MNPLTEKLIRASFVNCSRREASQLTLPADLSDLRWDRLDYLGWIDRKAPLRAYVVVPVDDDLVGITLRSPEGAASRRRAVCAWCEDVYATDDVSMYVARRAGGPGRNGDTIGTLICTDVRVLAQRAAQAHDHRGRSGPGRARPAPDRGAARAVGAVRARGAARALTLRPVVRRCPPHHRTARLPREPSPACDRSVLI